MGMINLPNQVFLLYFLWNEAFEKETYFTNNHIKFNETVIGFKTVQAVLHTLSDSVIENNCLLLL